VGAAADTTDLRSGAPLHDGLLALLPLVGSWQGTGHGVVGSSGEQFSFGQRVSFAHDGRPFLAYESRTWLLDADGGVIRSAFRESGFWRPGADADSVEALLASAAGLVEVFAGTAGDNSWDLQTGAVGMSATARRIDGERRLYAVRSNELAYVSELALPGAGFVPHLNATLARI
jgi:hypothetical protein